MRAVACSAQRPDFRRQLKSVRIIAGLGNPGRRYANTRHNMGWLALDGLAARCDGTEEERCGGLLFRSEPLWLFKPLDYMNGSGPPVARLVAEAGLAVDDLLVLLDDLNLSMGTIRIRAGGSSGGHKGLASVIEALGTDQFPRLRMGIGPCPAEVDAIDFVLSPFEPEELEKAERMGREAAEAAWCWAREGVQAAMNRFNRKAQSEEKP